MAGYQVLVIRRGRDLDMTQGFFWGVEGCIDRAKTLIRSGNIDPQKDVVYWIRALAEESGPAEIEFGEITHEDLGIVKRPIGRPPKEEKCNTSLHGPFFQA